MCVEFAVWLPSPNATTWLHYRVRTAIKNAQQAATSQALGPFSRPSAPLRIRLTRIAARRLDDDNLAYAFKAVRDAVARWLDVDDGASSLRWEYEQERRKLGTRVYSPRSSKAKRQAITLAKVEIWPWLEGSNDV